LAKVEPSFRIKLGVNVDHVATVRQARRIAEPDPVAAAPLCLLNGADIITVHLREDRRHIQDRDVHLLKETVHAKLNLEMAAAEEIVGIALELLPPQVTIVPEKREEITTEGGLDVVGNAARIREVASRFADKGIRVSLFVDPEEEQIRAARDAGAPCLELHTGRYSNATSDDRREEELRMLERGAEFARSLGLSVNAGHGLDYHNTLDLAVRVRPEELHIGHSIIGRAIFVGIGAAVVQMRAIIDSANHILHALA